LSVQQGKTMKIGESVVSRLTLALGLTAILGCDVATAPEPAEQLSSPTTPPTNCPGYAMPDRCPPFPTGGSNVITGSVLERTPEGTRPRPDRRVWAWVQRSNNGYSAGSVRTDADGNYSFPTLPDAFIVLQAGGDGYDQPCASTLQLTSSGAQATVEIVSETTPIYDPDPPAPGLRGVVFEMTPEGRRPVARARVFVETLFEIVAATTMTDEQGRYSVCRLPTTGTYVTPVKEGYVLKGTDVALSGVVTLDLEMSRK
jgi:hypothetical protein